MNQKSIFGKDFRMFMKKLFFRKREIEPITAESEIDRSEAKIFTKKDFIGLSLGSVIYFGWFYFFVGLRIEHVGLYFLVLLLFFIHTKTQQFIIAFSIFIAYWIMYDSMRVLPNYKVNPIHIAEIYYFEKSWLGVDTEGVHMTLNEYFRIHHSPFLDVLSGIFYLNWVPIPLAFGFWLFRNDKRLFLKFSYAFVFTNAIGFSLYYCYPAAPPWYIEQYGFKIIYGTPGNAAGLIGFDKFLGIHLFENMYSKNANVFAAMPSMHSAYPVLCFLYGLRLRSWFLNVFFFIFTVGIWFAAVYTRHHYLIDVLAGASVAVLCFFSFEYLSEKTRLKRGFDFLIKKI